jgi:hypothetical protein
MSENEGCETMTVPAAGRKYFNLGRGASYRAARRGDIPTVNVGRLKRVPVRAMERRFDAVELEKSSGGPAEVQIGAVPQARTQHCRTDSSSSGA